MSDDDLAVRQPVTLRADPSRVILGLFVPGHPDEDTGRHVVDAVNHVLAIDDADVADGLAEIIGRFGGRHRDLLATFDHHEGRVADRLGHDRELSDDRRRLIGAVFTHEYSVEAAAVCNPSFVVAPDQRNAPDGSVDLVMSTRGIGEGHRSSVGFREVSVDQSGQVSVEDQDAHVGAGTVSEGILHATTFRESTRGVGDDAESTAWVLDQLGPTFTSAQLDRCLGELAGHRDTRPHVDATIHRLRALAARSYRVDFDSASRFSGRVLHPATAVERNGIEDARFVRFGDDDGDRYYGTYTAYDGTNIAQQLLESPDLRSFDSSPLVGPGARNKGLALFPRRIGGRFAALSRHDGASNAVAFTDDVRHWPSPTPIAGRQSLRNSIQVGNCGPPIETGVGWLTLTHGVGPMRTYSIGACLLDLDDPTQVIGELHRPLLSPQSDEQDGYVPNVVYSCGAVQHAGHLVIPFGVGDARIRFASVPVATVLEQMIAS